MPRRPIEQHPLYIDLEQYVREREHALAKTIERSERYVEDKIRQTEYEKARAILNAVKSGLSVYGAAKSAGIKSSLAKSTLIAHCEKVVYEFEKREEVLD